MSGPGRCNACAEFIEEGQEEWTVHGKCMEQGVRLAHARGVAEERARWTEAPGPLVGGGPYRAGDSPAAISRRLPPGTVAYLIAVDESVDATMGDRIPLAAMASSSPQDDRGAPEGSAGV